MQILKFNIRNQRLSRYNSALVAANSYKYLRCEFNFITEDWKNVEIKMANFYYKGRNYPVLIDENNQCEVPEEVIKLPSFKVSVFGGGITTNTITISVEDSGIFGEDNQTNMKYYNEVINKLTAKIDELNETKADNIELNVEANTIQLTANGTPIGDEVERDGEGVSVGDTSIYVPDVTEDHMLVFTLQDAPSEERLEFDIDPSNDWNQTDDLVDSNYLWEPME